MHSSSKANPTKFEEAGAVAAAPSAGGGGGGRGPPATRRTKKGRVELLDGYNILIHRFVRIHLE